MLTSLIRLSPFRFALLFALLVPWPAQLGAQNNAPSLVVGILPFQDVSANSDLGQLYTVLPNMLQALLLNKTQLVPRQVPGAPPGQAVDVATAAGLGQQAGTDVMAIGTLLSGSVKTSQSALSGFGFHGIQLGGNGSKIAVTVLLQVDLVDVNRGVKIATLRAKGQQSKDHFDPSMDSGNYGNINMQSAGFQNSVLAQATNRALGQLAEEMVSALKNFTPAVPGGQAAPAPAPAAAPPAATPAQAPMPVPVSGGAAAAPAPASPGAQPNLTAVKIDFVPGEKTIFFDDLSDMAPDEPPPHWKVRGSPVTLLMNGPTRELSLSVTRLTSPQLAFPSNFTFQTVLTYHMGNDGGVPAANWHFLTANGNDALFIRTLGDASTQQLTLQTFANGDDIGDVNVSHMDFAQPVHLDLWLQNGRARIYVNGDRVIDVNQVTIPQVVDMALRANRGEGDQARIGLHRVRLAESAPDFAAAMQASGKYVTHGIHFDTGSSILNSDSAPIVKQVADGLIGDPALTLEIDGYTDSIGGKASNLTLSQARADAVRSVLVSQFGIDAGRLTAKGFGPDHPLGSNDTAEGRAENRRVEFVKTSQ